MKKLFAYICISLMYCNVGFSYTYKFIDKDGYEKTVEVRKNAVLLCNSLTEKKAIKYIFNYYGHTMTTSKVGNEDYEINILGSPEQGGIISYSIAKSRNEVHFKVINSNLDNYFQIVTYKGNLSDFNKIMRIVRKIDFRINFSTKLITIPSNYIDTDLEQKKYDAIVTFMSSLKEKNKKTTVQKCHGTSTLYIKDGVILDDPFGIKELLNSLKKNN